MGRFQHRQPVVVRRASVVGEVDVGHGKDQLPALPSVEQRELRAVRLRCDRIEQHRGGHRVAAADLALFHGVLVLGPALNGVGRREHLVPFTAGWLQRHAGAQGHRVAGNGGAESLVRELGHFVLLFRSLRGGPSMSGIGDRRGPEPVEAGRDA